MANLLLSQPILNGTLSDILKDASRGAGYDDVAVLGFLALCSAGWMLRGTAWDKPDPYHYKWFERPQESQLSGKNIRKETRNIAQKLEETGKDVVIFWGSQSGTAEGFANRLTRDFHRRFRLEAMAADLSDFDPQTIALIPTQKFAIFIMSTYGEGDPSDNSSDFWNWLRNNEETSLPHLRYMAFGLGNSNYKFYNRVIDVVTGALDKFGATPMLNIGRADDCSGTTEEDFLEWKENVFSVFRTTLNLIEREPEYEPTLAVVEDDSMTAIDLHLGEPVQQWTAKKTVAASSPIRALPMKISKELFSKSNRSCIHMELDLNQNPKVKYKTGDHCAVWPTNPDVEVERILRVLGLEARKDIPISLSSLNSATKLKIPTPTTVHALFQHYLEICSPVSRETVLSLAQFAPTPSVKAVLTQIGKDKETYLNFLSRNYMTIGRLLEYSTQDHEATWTSLPLSFLIETIPPMTPRYYSISSSSIVQPRQLSLTAVVSDTHIASDPSQRIFGLATNYLVAQHNHLNGRHPHPYNLTYPLSGPNDILANGKIHANIRQSTFKLPHLSSHPIIMVAAGTGIAPFRGFLQERARLRSMDREVGRMLLFFGCRNPEEDFLYQEELEEMQRGALKEELSIVTAFSRPTDAAEKKVYVQDRIEEYAGVVCEMLENANTHFYICGSAGMARDVAKRLGECLKRERSWDEGELRMWSEKQKRLNRWQEDVWG